jgi:hypothetical protein
LKNTEISNFIEIAPVGANLFNSKYVGTDRERVKIMKLIVAYNNFAITSVRYEYSCCQKDWNCLPSTLENAHLFLSPEWPSVSRFIPLNFKVNNNFLKFLFHISI